MILAYCWKMKLTRSSPFPQVKSFNLHLVYSWKAERVGMQFRGSLCRLELLPRHNCLIHITKYKRKHLYDMHRRQLMVIQIHLMFTAFQSRHIFSFPPLFSGIHLQVLATLKMWHFNSVVTPGENRAISKRRRCQVAGTTCQIQTDTNWC